MLDLNITPEAQSTVLRKQAAGVSLRRRGLFKFECYDKYGNKKWEAEAENGSTTEGLNHILDTEFHGSSQESTWYIGLIDNSGFTEFVVADTLLSHAGWTALTDYTGDRKEWTEGASVAGSITNASTVNFAMTATKTVKGAFLCSAATGLSSVILFCTAAFTGGTQAVENGDTLKVTYTITIA